MAEFAAAKEQLRLRCAHAATAQHSCVLRGDYDLKLVRQNYTTKCQVLPRLAPPVAAPTHPGCRRCNFPRHRCCRDEGVPPFSRFLAKDVLFHDSSLVLATVPASRSHGRTRCSNF